ncbi:hypothetical protein M0R45_001771 [Rubus argutus]|uniref:Reverse transcriptase n=1 Tax=Rubus argutus TaxID=59490 RepID=A0AAW1VKU4_RUBAR
MVLNNILKDFCVASGQSINFEKSSLFFTPNTPMGLQNKLGIFSTSLQQLVQSEFLSQAGKEVLIKAVATAVPAYPMSCFKMPVTLCRAINSEIANFWWGLNEDSKKFTGRLGQNCVCPKVMEEWGLEIWSLSTLPYLQNSVGGFRTTRKLFGFVSLKPDISTTASSSKPKLAHDPLGLGVVY